MSNKSKAALWMLGSSLSFALMAAAVRLSGDLPLAAKLFFRNVVALIIAAGVVWQRRAPLWGLPRRDVVVLLARSMFGVLGVLAYFYSIERMQLATSNMLNRLSPFFVILFGGWLLREKLTKIQLPATIVVFLASLLIIKPSFTPEAIPATVGFIGALFAGAAYIAVRSLHDRVDPATIVFYFAAFTLVVTFPFVLLNPVSPTPGQWAALFGIGVFAAGGQFGLTLAYKYEQAGEVSLYTYSQVLLNGLIGLALWHEVPDAWSVIGGTVIIGTSVLVFVYNRRQRKRELASQR